MTDKTPSAAPAPESHPDELRIRGAIHMIEEGDLCHWNFDHDRVTLSALRLALADYTPAPAREAIARAICLACEENPDHRGDARGNDWRWQDYLGAADAAIAAGATPAPAPAVPARQAISQLFAIAADLAQLKPIARLSSLGGNRHIGHRQFGGAYMASEEALRGLAVRLRGAIDAITAATPAPAQAVPLVQQTAPERIWLQISDDATDAGLPFATGPDVTWSRDEALTVTVPYVRADLATYQPGLQDAVQAPAAADRDLMIRYKHWRDKFESEHSKGPGPQDVFMAMAAAAAPVPPGYSLVPVEPTALMLRACNNGPGGHVLRNDEIWRAMLAAAPKITAPVAEHAEPVAYLYHDGQDAKVTHTGGDK